MRLLYECDCGHRWKGRDKITHPSRCPKCNSRDIRLAGSKIKV